ncbi:hypothetical protein KIS1582_1407 [Cytobacillus firmus]|uniref:Uncharacterized protein n=1 Tax=Cytobacillus firmus TaxID=1399 RepID=A0A800NBQ8_CYTFI|nr:hypothetical protein KIS1582_1407 [Cytobacillus firmus]
MRNALKQKTGAFSKRAFSHILSYGSLNSKCNYLKKVRGY